MPIREFVCRGCDFKTERIEFTPDPTLPICPRCERELGFHVEMGRVDISTSTPHFKGAGWAKDGYSSTTLERGPSA